MIPFVRPDDDDDVDRFGRRRDVVDLVSDSESEGTEVDAVNLIDDDDEEEDAEEEITMPRRPRHRRQVLDSDDEDDAKADRPPPAQNKRVVIEISDSEDEPPAAPRHHVAQIKYHPPAQSKRPQPSSYTIDMREACAVPPAQFAPQGWAITPEKACDLFNQYPSTPEWRADSWKELIRRVQHVIRPDLRRVKSPHDIMDSKDLAHVFEAFDSVYFQGSLWRRVCEDRGTLKFELSKRHARSAGMCTKQGCAYEIKIYLKIFRELFRASSDQHFISSGLPCHTRLECLLNVFSHELCHLLMQRFCHHRDKTHHGPTFQKLAFHLFGHTDFRHELDVARANMPSSSDRYAEVARLYKANRKHVFTVQAPSLTDHTKCVILRLNKTRARVETIEPLSRQFLVPYRRFERMG